MTPVVLADLVPDGQSVELTRLEGEVLQVLLRHRDRPMTRDEILAEMHSADRLARTVIDLLVCRLRSKLARAGVHDAIATVRDSGYMVRAAGEAPEPAPSPTGATTA